MSLYFNWKELEFYLDSVRPLLVPSKIEQILIPERKFSRDGFIKGEWNFRLKNPNGFFHINFSLLPKRPTFAIYEDRGPNASHLATLPPFVQILRKELTGAIIDEVQQIERDRTVFFTLKQGEKKTHLYLYLFPNRPNAQLVLKGRVIADAHDPNLKIRNFEAPQVPSSSRAMGIRTDVLDTPWKWGVFIQEKLIQTELENRKSVISRTIRTKLKSVEQSISKLSKTLTRAQNEPDWSKFGDLLKANLHEKLTPNKKFGKTTVAVYDYESGAKQTIPYDSKLKPQSNVEKFYRLATRHRKRLEESSIRKKELEKQKHSLSSHLVTASNANGFREILELESIYLKDAKKKRTRKSWDGRTFTSKNGFSIYVGKTENENRSLTFHVARGSDIWLHIKNRPSSHVLIVSQKNKSIPLETLLDAAQLCVYFTMGKSRSKVDVDYTFRKNVSSIPKSTKVTYHSEKTLHVEIEPKRIERLLGTN